MGAAFTITQPLGAEHLVLTINGQERTIAILTDSDGSQKVYVQLPGVMVDKDRVTPQEGSRCAIALLNVLSKSYEGQGDESLAEYHAAMRMLLTNGMLLANPKYFDPARLDPADAQAWRKQLRNAKDKGVWNIVYDMSRKKSFVAQLSAAQEEIPVTLWGCAS